MSVDPSYNLQKAVYETLMAANLGTLNVYHTVPQNKTLPWVLIGDDQILPAYEAGDFSECFVDVHVFGKKPDFKNIAAKVRLALDLPISVTGFMTMEAWFDGTRYLTEADAQTGHAVLTFRYLLQPV